MTPFERIAKAGSKMRADYQKVADLPKLVASAQFRSLYESSGFSSVESFADVAGLSVHQARRIIDGTSLPAVSSFEPARNRLISFFGEPRVDMKQIHSVKRIAAVAAILESLEFPLPIHPLLSREHTIRNIADGCNRMVPPDHHTLASTTRYSEWVAVTTKRDSLATTHLADAIGTFSAAREYLPGFLDRLIQEARLLYEKQRDRSALELLTAIRGIELTRASLKQHGNDLHSVRRNLQVQFAIDNPPHAVNSSVFLSELVKPWNLTVDDITRPNTTTGYLVMESSVVRSLALHVLHNHDSN